MTMIKNYNMKQKDYWCDTCNKVKLYIIYIYISFRYHIYIIYVLFTEIGKKF